ncbi:MAG: DUF1475 family protein [Pseudomonadota bacterium]
MTSAPSGTAMPRWLIAIAAGVFVVLAGSIGWASTNGALGDEFPALVAMPWGFVTVVDLYAGLVLVAAWVVWREPRWPVALLWTLALFSFGNLATCVYLLLALRQSRGDARDFWFGHRAIS